MSEQFIARARLDEATNPARRMNVVDVDDADVELSAEAERMLDSFPPHRRADIRARLIKYYQRQPRR